MKSLWALLFLLTALSTSSLWGGVNLKNGNFYVSYTDIVVPGAGNNLEITRTYNSKATEKGWFGFGWASKFETYLVVGVDGSVVVHEQGAGAKTRFTPRSPIDPKAAATKIVEAMRKKGRVNSQKAKELMEKFEKDAELRHIYARRLGIKSQLSNGTILHSNNRGLQKLKKIKTGFVRQFNNGKLEHFDNDGKLAKLKEKNGYTVSLNYKKSELKSIKDSEGKQLFFEWFPDNKVKSIWSAGDKKATYKYRGTDLVETKDVNGNVYKHEYDTNHNMIGIQYADGKSMKMTYEPGTYFISSITDKQDRKTVYSYGNNPKNPNFHYWTNVTKKARSGKEIKNKYEYEIKTKADGEQYTYRIATAINGLNTETIFSECCSLPVKITRGNTVTEFKYNDKGLLTKKTSTTGEYIELDYHPKFNKITKVVNKKGTTKFKYDKVGNLSVAESSEGKKIKLVYDPKGRISVMVDRDRGGKTRKLKFDYNQLGKPNVITMENVGAINVEYDNYGEIKKVESKAGHKMALQVTQAFQSLLSIVKPAGVNLSL